MRHNEAPTKYPVAESIARSVSVTGVIASMTFPVFARDGIGLMPQNADLDRSGNRWNCNRGFRLFDVARILGS